MDRPMDRPTNQLTDGQTLTERCVDASKKSYFVRNISLDSVYILLAHESYLRYNIQLHKRILLFVETCAIK